MLAVFKPIRLFSPEGLAASILWKKSRESRLTQAESHGFTAERLEGAQAWSDNLIAEPLRWRTPQPEEMDCAHSRAQLLVELDALEQLR